MKIRSIEKIKAPETTQFEVVLKDRNRQSIVTESSISHVNMNAVSPTSWTGGTAFDVPLRGAVLSEIGMVVIADAKQYRKFLNEAKFNSKLDRMNNQKFKSVISEQTAPRWKVLQESFAELVRTRLGLIVDGLADDYDVVARKKRQLESMGYDCMVCFVNIPLQNAVSRNDEQLLHEDQVVGLWRNLQKSMSHYAQLFEGNIVVVDGSSKASFTRGMEFAVDNFATEPVNNRVAQNIMIRSRTVHTGE